MPTRAVLIRACDYREVLILRELEELSYKAIAYIVGVPLGTVMSRFKRARIQLQRALLNTWKSRDVAPAVPPGFGRPKTMRAGCLRAAKGKTHWRGSHYSVPAKRENVPRTWRINSTGRKIGVQTYGSEWLAVTTTPAWTAEASNEH